MGKGYSEEERHRMGLPFRPFLYTLDQIASLLDMPLASLKKDFIHFDGRTTGAFDKHAMMARNIRAAGFEPDWRVAEKELIRWMKLQGWMIYESQWLKSQHGQSE